MNNQALSLHLVQTELKYLDVEANLKLLESKINSIEQKEGIVILPEMFNTGFTLKSDQFAESMDGLTVSWMRNLAVQQSMSVCGTLIISENGQAFNRFVWVDSNGDVHTYNKRHLYRMGEENSHFSPGDDTGIFQYQGWKIRPLVCYDIRFPVWSRNQMTDDKTLSYDLLIVSANWPMPKTHVWETLLKARAIENQAYVAGVNLVGTDGNGYQYEGHSIVVHPKGHLLNEAANVNNTISVNIDKHSLNNYREEFPAWQDADAFGLA